MPVKLWPNPLETAQRSIPAKLVAFPFLFYSTAQHGEPHARAARPRGPRDSAPRAAVGRRETRGPVYVRVGLCSCVLWSVAEPARLLR